MLRRLRGGPYATSYVFDLRDFITPHLRLLRHHSYQAPEDYLNEVIEYAIWRAGKVSAVLDLPDAMISPSLPLSLRSVITTLIHELQPVLYRALRPIVFDGANGHLLRPTAVIYQRGEVWLCWKTPNLF